VLDGRYHRAVQPRLSAREVALVLVVVTLWGFAFVPAKWALLEVSPFVLAMLRFLFAAVPAVFVVPPPRVHWRIVAAYGVAIGVLQYGLMFLGMQLGMPAGLSSLVMQLQVYFTILLAAAFLRDRMHRWNVLGALVALTGAAVLGLAQFRHGATATLAGFLLLVGAALAWGAGNVVAKRGGGRDFLGLVVWSSLVAAPLLAIVSVIAGGVDALHAIARASWRTWAAVLFLSWLATLFGFSAWNRLLHRHPAALVTPFALLVPVSGLASGALFLDERLTALQMVGVTLVLAGLVVNVFGPAWWARLRATGGA
jgi:O-acetylserine/cysteine efflux transporter